MEEVTPRYTLATLAQILGGTPEGPPDAPLDQPAAAGNANPLGVAFAESEEYLFLAESSEIGAIIVSRDARPSSKPLIRVDHPRSAFGKLLAMSQRPLPLTEGIHPTAIVAPSVDVHPTARIGPYVVVEGQTTIGEGAKIFPFCYVGEGCSLAENVVLYPHCVLYRDVSLGPGTIIHSGAVLGADGFGFVWDGQKRVKVPQVGRVEVGAHVELGVNTAVDRATAGTTLIGEGVKIDNLVQVAHNVSIGEHSVIAAQSGLSGSTNLGKRVMMGGGVGTRDHVEIADDVVLGGRSTVDQDIPKPGAYFGTPARPMAEAKRSFLLFTKLPELFSRLRALERKIKEREK